MDLKSLNVLIDGYNLQLTKGTGIKTYGLSLIQALRSLGANVDVLFGKRKSSTDPILNEVLFFDFIEENSSRFRNLTHRLRTASFFFYSAKLREIRPFHRKVIIDKGADEYIDSVGILNLKDCYRGAFILYKLLGHVTEFRAPKKIDLWHATMPLPVRIKGAKKITTIHDLIPLRLPYTTLDDKKVFYKNVKDSLKHSDMIVADSENTKKDILEFFDVNPDKIRVIYLPIGLKWLGSGKEAVSGYLRKYNLRSGNYILFVGAIEPRKNIGRLIDAYTSINTEMPLVIAGKKAWLWEDEINKGSLKNVRFLEFVSPEDLKYLYTGAYCFVFPSFYEGFGLPPLEAMSFGCPVVTSHVASLPEICGEAALYVNPYDTKDISEKIGELLNNSRLRTELSEAGRERAKMFSMENYMKGIYEAYRKALDSEG